MAKTAEQQFTLARLIAAMYEALEAISKHPIGYGETFNGSPEMGARPCCPECLQKRELSEAVLRKVKG